MTGERVGALSYKLLLPTQNKVRINAKALSCTQRMNFLAEQYLDCIGLVFPNVTSS